VLQRGIADEPRNRPRLGGLADVPGTVSGDVFVEVVSPLDEACLAVHGPPGSGKTRLGARAIVDLLPRGYRVGVTATSHKVIGNLLVKVTEEARRTGLDLRALQKCVEEDACGSDLVRSSDSISAVHSALMGGDVHLVGVPHGYGAARSSRASSTTSSSTRRVRCP
jgi:KaiC/GvpD/RAD55 family RecA-like ATPase